MQNIILNEVREKLEKSSHVNNSTHVLSARRGQGIEYPNGFIRYFYENGILVKKERWQPLSYSGYNTRIYTNNSIRTSSDTMKMYYINGGSIYSEKRREVLKKRIPIIRNPTDKEFVFEFNQLLSYQSSEKILKKMSIKQKSFEGSK